MPLLSPKQNGKCQGFEDGLQRGAAVACRSKDLLAAPFLRYLDGTDLQSLAQAAHRIDVGAKRIVVAEGDEADGIYVIASGLALAVRYLSDGRRFISGLLFPGDAYGVSDFGGRYIWGLETAARSRLCHIPRRGLRAVPRVERLLLSYADHELAAAQSRMMMLGRKTARERIASFLLWRAERQRAQGLADNRLWLPLTRGDLADYLGLAMETTSRIMNDLTRKGLIASDGHAIVLHDVEALRSISGGN